ncbi:MAG: threonine synthase [Bryobacterales bacterium]|nr:threonine synthase [Bryobacterales bacterium]MBV9399007.1 threonine synthase [Bryobacterales bacterium]
MTALDYLECSRCSRRYERGKLHGLCECGGPLLVRYDLERLRREWQRDSISQGPSSMWRYCRALPVTQESSIVSLGEGLTPLIRVKRLSQRFGSSDLWVKDDGINPTGTFKARGMSCAISMCRELGVNKVAVPSAGNAAGAAAAYAAAAGIEAHIFMPRDVPRANYVECVMAGAKVTLVDGLISDCARIVSQRKEAEGWFDLSTLKEPYRIEGKKTMGYEIAEQFDWRLPDAILYPCGGGVGIIGMWKAFEEMEALGWISSQRPKMVAVQAAGCPPIVRAFEQGAPASEFYENAQTLASGLRVPKALGDFLALEAVRKSGGTAIAVSDDEIMEGVGDPASSEGIFAAPEGGACVAACKKLLANGFFRPSERVVIYNTGSGLKYIETYDR